MKCIKTSILFLLLIMPLTAMAQGMGQSGDFDLDELWAEARNHYDLEKEDAVILLDSRRIEFHEDESYSERIHRVVWIGTAVGVRAYADLRVPWNSAGETLEVEKLRTWREGRWWPDPEKVSDTAVVHTLPHALDHADDYTLMRETMLLHDGVELGCIMETAYTITRQARPAHGEIHVLAQADPVVQSELAVISTPRKPLQNTQLNGAPEPAQDKSMLGNRKTWRMRHVKPLARPHTSEPHAYEPTVVWTNWRHWDELRRHWMTAFTADFELTEEQKAGLLEKLNPVLSPRQKLAAVGEYLNEMVRRIRYDDSHWLYQPRPVSRVLNTAYGHDLDRAVLATALLQAAGFSVEPMMISEGRVLVAPTYARLSDMGSVYLRVDEPSDGLLDTRTGHAVAYDQVYGHPTWYVGAQSAARPLDPEKPEMKPEDPSLTLALNLAPGEDGKWGGQGHVQLMGQFSHFSELVGGSDLSAGYLDGLVGSVVSGAEAAAVTPTALFQQRVEADLTLGGFSIEPDDFDRCVLVAGQPAGGILDGLPGDVSLGDIARNSPVLGVGDWQQKIMLRLEVGADQVQHSPAPRRLENAAGYFQLEVEQGEDALVLTRTISLAGQAGAAENWPHLRALLLEEADAVNGTIILK
jgi:hypothetical protein